MAPSRKTIDLDQWLRQSDNHKPIVPRNIAGQYYRRLPKEEQRIWCAVVSTTVSLAVATPFLAESATRIWINQLSAWLSMW
jgi:hypothetical protein